MINSLNNRSGIIKVRIFAFLLLVISCCLFISSFKSIRREFKGRVIYKEVAGQLFVNIYDLYIIPFENLDDADFPNKIKSDASNRVFSKPPFNLNFRCVGVSSVVYENADFMCKITKEKFSPFVWVNEVSFLDKGLFWFIWGVFCSIMAVIIYLQTLKPKKNQKDFETEDLDI